ncbi:MAG: hypothetical protein Q9215_003078 [Flavoplaca cf. flavocitrina]
MPVAKTAEIASFLFRGIGGHSHSSPIDFARIVWSNEPRHSRTETDGVDDDIGPQIDVNDDTHSPGGLEDPKVEKQDRDFGNKDHQDVYDFTGLDPLISCQRLRTYRTSLTDLDKLDIVLLTDIPEVFASAISILLKQHATKNDKTDLFQNQEDFLNLTPFALPMRPQR